jgi:uncharacterized protein (DUF58 family)
LTSFQRLRNRFRAPRKLRFTREGKFLVGIALGVGFAAVNTGNNLLYLMLGVLLSLIVVSGILSEIAIRDLVVKRKLPARAQVDRPHLVEIEIYNSKLRMPSYAIEVEDLREGQPADKRCFFLKVSPRSSQIAAYRRTPTRRGRELHLGFRIATRFPFGLFEKSREISSEEELIIYPAVDVVSLAPSLARFNGGYSAVARLGASEEVISLRAHRAGDELRNVYWRKSAATGQLVLKERAADNYPEVAFHLEVTRPAAGQAAWAVAFEQRIREVASLSLAHIRRGDRVTVTTNGQGRVEADRGQGVDPVLRFLALVEAVDERRS